MAVRDEYLKVNNTFEGMQEKVHVTFIVFYNKIMNLRLTVALKISNSFDIFQASPDILANCACFCSLPAATKIEIS